MAKHLTEAERIEFVSSMDDTELLMAVVYVRMQHPLVFDEVAAAIGRCRGYDALRRAEVSP